MLRVTADIYSGRPNPSWIVEDEARARRILKEVVEQGGQVSRAETDADLPLGMRGLIIEPVHDELARDLGMEVGPIRLTIGAPGVQRGRDLAARLIKDVSSFAPTAETAEWAEAMTQPLTALQDLMLENVLGMSGETVEESPMLLPAPGIEPAALVTCRYERSPYNPGFWNNNAFIRANNNCYNYASNKRTDTFAQPGRGCGNMYRALTCPEVTRASLCDGLHRRYDCFPESERPRYLAALVIWPGNDFHWYRLQREGFWAHKPGSTPVRNVDNSGRIITDPATANRGPYTQFCGYFYTCRTQRIR